MNNTKEWYRHILINGLILGVSLSFLEFVALFLGMIFRPVMFFIYLIVFEFILLVAIRKYRDQILNGKIEFTNALLTGIFVSLTGGFVWAIYRYYQYTFAPQLVTEIVGELINILKESALPEEQIKFAVAFYEKAINPFTLAFVKTFIFTMGVGGTILSLFLAFVLKRPAIPNNRMK
jgi:hypothetical protein